MRVPRVKNATLPNGPATLVFRKWQMTKSKKGNPMFVLTHTPVTGEPIIEDYLSHETAFGYYKLQAFLSAIGVGLTDDEELDTEVLDQVLGCEFEAQIKNEMFNDVSR